MTWRGAIVALALAMAPGVLSAQVVRGRVLETSSAAPVAGAIVSLQHETGDSVFVSVLTAATGEYAIRAAAPGRYRVSVKRIGVRRSVSEAFALAAGETRALDISIDAVAQTLPTVTVSGLCVNRANQQARIASLWDEVRAALEATSISLRDQLMEVHIERYTADLNPTTFEVLYDWRTEAELMVKEPFTSVSGDVLSAEGYWREIGTDSIQYSAPDARALLSDAFLRDHCFSLAATRPERRELIGVDFQPASGRKLPDIAGTVWIDSASFELRYVEFRYTQLPAKLHRLWCNCAFPAPIKGVGGEVHFSRLASGAWIVHRWFLRLPQMITALAQTGNLGLGRYTSGSYKQVREVGGVASTEGITMREMTSAMGVVRDSANRPVPDAVVYALGAHRETRTATDGTYRLDSLPVGSVSIVVRTTQLDSLGLLAAAHRVEPRAGGVSNVDVRTPDAKSLYAMVCPLTNVPWRFRPVNRGILRLLVLDSLTAEPLTGVRLVVSWPATTENPRARAGTLRTREAVTDSRGAASFCDLPGNLRLELAMDKMDGMGAHLMMFEVNRNEIMGRVIRTNR